MKQMNQLTGRKCYDHLGGKLGAKLLDFFIANDWIRLEDGKSTVYVLTPKGEQEFKAN